MPGRPWLTVNWDRNMMGGPRRFWPAYANVLGLIGTGVALVVAFLLLALLLSPWFWIGYAVPRDHRSDHRHGASSSPCPAYRRVMETCSDCGTAVLYLYDARPGRSSTYSWFCIGDPTHVFPDLSTAIRAS
jgi:hypothetical protein